VTGTTADLIPIIIVPVVALAFMLVMVNYANSHPQWRSQAPADTDSTHLLEGGIPAQRLSSPGPVVPGQRLGVAADEVAPEQPRAREAQAYGQQRTAELGIDPSDIPARVQEFLKADS